MPWSCKHFPDMSRHGGTNQFWKKMFTMYDVDGDGALNEDEWTAVMIFLSSAPRMISKFIEI